MVHGCVVKDGQVTKIMLQPSTLSLKIQYSQIK